MVSDGHSKHDHGRLLWPELTNANGIPTPYQIFNQKKGSPYSKQRFYELVMLYHPDRHDLNSSTDGLSHATKLERYRLVIAANNILADPVKRSAYDLYGAGWNGQPDVASFRDSAKASNAWGGCQGNGWSGPHGPSQNATWEDWEKWYQRDAKGSQEPRFVSNSAFVGLILIFAALGGIGQATRVGNSSMSLLEQSDALHDRMSKDLRRRRKETAITFGSREERIHSFLEQRDPGAYGAANPHEESSRKLLSQPEAFLNEDIKGERIDIYRQHENPKGR